MPRKLSDQTKTVGFRATPEQHAAIRMLLADHGVPPKETIAYLLGLLDAAGDAAKLEVAQTLGLRSPFPSEALYRSACDSAPARQRLARLGHDGQRAAAEALANAIALECEPSDWQAPADVATTAAPEPITPLSPGIRRDRARRAAARQTAEPSERSESGLAQHLPDATQDSTAPVPSAMVAPDPTASTDVLTAADSDPDPCPVYTPGKMSAESMRQYQLDVRAWRARNPGH